MTQHKAIHETANHPRQIPLTLIFPGGGSIDTEELISQLSLLRGFLAKQLDDAAENRHREPLAYPEATAAHTIVSSAYHALAGMVYADKIAAAADENRPSFI